MLEWKYKAAENEHFQTMAVLDIDREVFIFTANVKRLSLSLKTYDSHIFNGFHSCDGIIEAEQINVGFTRQLETNMCNIMRLFSISVSCHLSFFFFSNCDSSSSSVPYPFAEQIKKFKHRKQKSVATSFQIPMIMKAAESTLFFTLACLKGVNERTLCEKS